MIINLYSVKKQYDKSKVFSPVHCAIIGKKFKRL